MEMAPGTGSAVRLLGTRIDRLRSPDLIDRVTRAAHSRQFISVLYVNVHCMNVADRDGAYALALECADIVYCDGTGVRVAAKLVGVNIPERMTGADWINPLCSRAAADGLSLYLLGGEPGVARAAADALRQRHVGLRIAGTGAGFGLNAKAVDDINARRPDILLVGMGTPTQEKWIAANRELLDVPVVWAVGALFEFVTGQITRGPRWMTAHGMEWICRLAAEPRKLWRRYLIGNPAFFLRLLREYYVPRP